MALRLPTPPEAELRQRDLIYLLPGGLLALGGVFCFHLLTLPEQARGFFIYYPMLVLTVGLFLGWRFNRTRLVFALLALLLAEQTLRHATGGAAYPVAVAAVELLLPLNLAMISCFVERGLFTRPGALRAAAIVLQPLLLLWLQRSGDGLGNFLTKPLLVWPWLEHLPLAQVPLAGLLLGGGLLLLRFLLHPSAIDGGFLWTLAVVILPLGAGMQGEPLTLWFATAGLILTVSLIESSHRMAYRDELTGLPARRALTEELLKTGRIYTIAMVDVDHFKKVNDTHGHDVGDQVLKMVAAHIEEVSGGGRPFRYGGEEFTVLFPNKSVREALPHLEELRLAIERSGFILRSPQRPAEKPEPPPKNTGGEKLRVTVSIGVAERNDFNRIAGDVIKAADQALYRAKEEGRNRVCRAGGGRN